MLTASDTSEGMPELRITRIFQAPRRLVYEAFCDAEQARQWIGPKAFVATHLEQDVRPGGKWRACLRQVDAWQARDYPDLWMGGTFQCVQEPELLVYTFAWEGQGGQPTRETLVTIRLTEIDPETTRMDFHQAFFDSTISRDDHGIGWHSEFDCLSGFLRSRARHSLVAI